MKFKKVRDLYRDFRPFLQTPEYENKYNNPRSQWKINNNGILERDLKDMCLTLSGKIDPYNMPNICRRYIKGKSNENKNLN